MFAASIKSLKQIFSFSPRRASMGTSGTFSLVMVLKEGFEEEEEKSLRRREVLTHTWWWNFLPVYVNYRFGWRLRNTSRRSRHEFAIVRLRMRIRTTIEVIASMMNESGSSCIKWCLINDAREFNCIFFSEKKSIFMLDRNDFNKRADAEI